MQCGSNRWHPCHQCHAKNERCRKCGKPRHFNGYVALKWRKTSARSKRSLNQCIVARPRFSLAPCVPVHHLGSGARARSLIVKWPGTWWYEWCWNYPGRRFDSCRFDQTSWRHPARGTETSKNRRCDTQCSQVWVQGEPHKVFWDTLWPVMEWDLTLKKW